MLSVNVLIFLHKMKYLFPVDFPVKYMDFIINNIVHGQIKYKFKIFFSICIFIYYTYIYNVL